MKRRYLTLGDFSNDTQIYILGVVIARLTMRLLRAGIDPESVLTQKAPNPEEKRRMQETSNRLIGQIAVDYLDSDVEEITDEHGAIIMDADVNTLRLVALNLARVIACNDLDGREVPGLGQKTEHERWAMLLLAHHCQLFGRDAHDRPPER